MRTLLLCCVLLFNVPQGAHAQRSATPLRQSGVQADATDVGPLTLRDASRNDRWLGLEVRDVRWAPDGSGVYFRWNEAPGVDDVPLADPWYRVTADGRSAELLSEPAEIRAVPGPEVIWSADGRYAAWASANSVYLHVGGVTRPIATLTTPVESVRFAGSEALDVVSAEALYRYVIEGGSLALLAARHTVAPNDTTAEGAWLARQQEEVFQHVRAQGIAAERAAAANRSTSSTQLIPSEAGKSLDVIQMSPDGRYLTFKERAPATDRPSTQFIDFVDASGYSAVRTARAKTGEPRDVVRLGVLPVDPSKSPDSVQVTWIELPEAGDQRTIPHGPYWSPDGTRALVQFIGEDHKDVWFAELDLATGETTVLAHDHDEGWIGGPPIQANYLQPALVEWLPDGSWIFASERSGWSHLYRVDAEGEVTPLTSGEWEVRNARLNRDRDTWLLQASQEHPSDDHLYRMPAGGGDLEPLTEGVGRNEGWLSPDGDRIAVINSTATTLPDLFVGSAEASDRNRVTVSGTENFQNQRLSEPTIVSFPHPDGQPVWAALYAPVTPHPDRPAVIHIHGGGYRQFAHRGWSVYGWALHVGFLNYLVQQGYTVLDFDYRGGAGFGRDYRTDVAGAMGIKDADGVAAAARYLTREHGIDPSRIGMHGVSYGGFLTLMTLFRHPGVVTAGIARASVTDWAHYSDGWTSRILGVPHENPEAYELSSPIYYADGLQDNLLLTHGVVDDNVHFQDAARLVQKLIELEKEFEVMVYPVEPHTIQTEASRYDFVRRAADFFERHLLGGR